MQFDFEPYKYTKIIQNQINSQKNSTLNKSGVFDCLYNNKV